MEIAEIPYGSPLYEAAKSLRQDILRTPLGLTLSAKDIEGEVDQIHIVYLQEDAIKGAVILKPLSAQRVKLRQMAIHDDCQGKGIGRSVIAFAEMTARARHFKQIEMHARVSARKFYEKLGYTATGDIFAEVTVPTIKMVKIL